MSPRMRFSDHVVIFSYKYSALGIYLYSHLITSSDLYLDTDFLSEANVSLYIILLVDLCHYSHDLIVSALLMQWGIYSGGDQCM